MSRSVVMALLLFAAVQPLLFQGSRDVPLPQAGPWLDPDGADCAYSGPWLEPDG